MQTWDPAHAWRRSFFARMVPGGPLVAFPFLGRALGSAPAAARCRFRGEQS